jgi:uncharacterized protein involved in exopolysaccharide biosynthesis
MSTQTQLPPAQTSQPQWLTNARLLWDRRRLLVRVGCWTFIVSLVIALLIPTQYESTARIMPPDQASASVAMLAALARSGGSTLGGLATSLTGARTSGALFIDLLGSKAIADRLIDRFHLQKLYGKRYRVDTIRKLASYTSISDDKKSGVITIAVTDTDRQRARDMAQAYLDELDALITRVNDSSAHRERIFIEQRLVSVQADLEQAQLDLSDFSSAHTAIDIKEQTRAMVDAGARMQGQLIAAQSELDSTEQIYGEENVRVRAARARVGILQSELQKLSGSGESDAQSEDLSGDHPYPALRALPQLGVRWADLYRRVRIQETVFDLLSAQHETARIEEAKDTPSVSVLDSPSWPEKKSSPHRALIVLGSVVFAVIAASLLLLLQRSWQLIPEDDSCKLLVREMAATAQRRLPRFIRRRAEV